MHDIRIGPAAQADVDVVCRWYESERPEAVRLWLEAFDWALKSVRKHPQWYVLIAENIRRIKLRRHSYTLYYRFSENEIEVLGVFHDRQSPDRWQSRFRE